MGFLSRNGGIVKCSKITKKMKKKIKGRNADVF